MPPSVAGARQRAAPAAERGTRLGSSSRRDSPRTASKKAPWPAGYTPTQSDASALMEGSQQGKPVLNQWRVHIAKRMPRCPSGLRRRCLSHQAAQWPGPSLVQLLSRRSRRRGWDDGQPAALAAIRPAGGRLSKPLQAAKGLLAPQLVLPLALQL